jgi:catechol 2,3-dioxygenase-like lactoylglutathione lyase family enzyme
MPLPIPGLAGIEHIGLTVPDIATATAFFAGVIGAETLYDIGPFESADDWMASHLAVKPHSRITRIRVLKVANGPVLELFEFAAPGQDSPTPGKTDYGGWHLAFYVDDMDKAQAALREHGCEIQSGPVTMTEGPSAGLEWLYFKAPWGQQLELVSYPGGIAAYKEKQLSIWRPRL